MFSYLATPSKILTDKAIEKLQQLKKEIQPLTDTNKNDSDISITMVSTVIDIIDCLIENNTIPYWKDRGNQKRLRGQLAILDNGIGSCVPEVFDARSFELAKAINRLLNQIDLDTDVNVITRKALSSVVNVQEWLGIMHKNIESKISFYEILVKDGEQTEKLYSTLNGISDHFEAFNKALENDDLQFIQQYNDICKALINEVTALPFIRICNSRSYVDLKKPIDDPSDIISAGNRVTCILSLIHKERELNLVLKEKELPLVTSIYDHYSTICKQEECDTIEQTLSNIANNMFNIAEVYKKGGYLGNFAERMFKRGVDKDKVACFDQLCNTLNAILKEEEPIGVLSFKAFTATLKAINRNRDISVKKEISLGKLSKLLNDYSNQFFDFSYNQVHEVNSRKILDTLQQYSRELSIEETGKQALRIG